MSHVPGHVQQQVQALPVDALEDEEMEALMGTDHIDDEVRDLIFDAFNDDNKARTICKNFRMFFKNKANLEKPKSWQGWLRSIRKIIE